MKKYIILSILLMIIFPGLVNAKNGGICFGKTLLSQNYCNLDSNISVGRKQFTPAQQTLIFPNGSKPAWYDYFGSGNHMYCIDDTKNPPLSTNTLKVGRALDVTSDADATFARLYQLYINSVQYLINQGTSKEQAESRYLQDFNVALRVLVEKWRYSYESSKDFKSVLKQLEGQPTTGATLKNNKSTDDVSIVNKWYCQAALSCTKCNYPEGLSKANLRNYCEKKFPGFMNSVKAPKNYDIKLAQDNTIEIKTVTSGSKFTQEVPVKISGLSLFLSSTWLSTNPFLKIKSVSCDDPLKCEIKNASDIINKNLLDFVKSSKNDEYTITVIVSGNVEDFKKKPNANLVINYDSYHILNPRNLAFLKVSALDTNFQRMFMLMPYTAQAASASLPIALPSMCNASIEGGKQIYRLGTDVVTAKEYLEFGCCNVVTKYLDTDEKSIYANNCQIGDEVYLESICTQTCDGPAAADFSHSYAYQLPITDILNVVSNLEQTYVKGGYSNINALIKDLNTKTSNHRDDNYTENNVSSGNNYCKTYTSERSDIYYPTTAVSTSGRFFVFQETGSGNNIQPYIEGEITGAFYTMVDAWEKDFEAAINDEKNKFDAWQEALALYDAVEQLGYCDRTSTNCNCGCCWTGPLDINGDKTCGPKNCNCSKRYVLKGAPSAKTRPGVAFNLDGTSKTKTASISCKCGGTRSKTSGPTKSAVDKLKSTYIAAKNKRITLQSYSTECQNASKNLKNNWNYYLNPELNFNYEQCFLEGTQKRCLVETVPMEISTSAVKYWPEVSSKVRSSNEKGSLLKDSYKISYGGPNGVNSTFEYNQNKEYSVTKSQDLYFKPSTKYYSLVPSGKVMTDQEIYTNVPALDIGYVFNVQISSFEGDYLTWFTLNNTGHVMNKSKPKAPNIQNSINDYLAEHANEFTDNDLGIEYSEFSSKCYYCNEEILFERTCVTCEDGFIPQYIYRTIATNEPDPNNRFSGEGISKDSNWATTKGLATIDEIKKYGMESNTFAEENLEYDFILTTSTLQEIKNKYNRQDGKKINYSDFNFTCPGGKGNEGKECESELLTMLAQKSETESLLNQTRKEKWKYFINGKWKSGSIKTLFTDKTYPDLKSAIVDKNTIWP